jgi:CDP-paratose 2-epimerase
MKVLVAGSNGLVGSEAVVYYHAKGASVIGIDNNMRRDFFGPAGDTIWMLTHLKRQCPGFVHYDIDIRDRAAVFDLLKKNVPDIIIHCAAQPSHDLAKDRPLDDFDVNAVGTINLLEATRQHRPEAVFVFASTNKVYGNAPNEILVKELPSRWEYERAEDYNGVSEQCRIDNCLHSLFGASKAAADIVCQEYGKYFGMKVGIFRAGCMTGQAHSGVPLHGFLSYLVKVAVRNEVYTIIGYKGKQVRDQIHSHDVVAAFDAFARNPRPGEVYNLGGGRENSASVLECIAMLQERLGRPVRTEYVDQPRIGDHICYISDLGKLRQDYPEWRITKTLPDIIDGMLATEFQKGTMS